MKSPTESSTAISGPTATNSDPCYHFASINFETGSSTAPYIVNVSLNAPLALVTNVANTLVLSAIRKKYLLPFALKTFTREPRSDRSWSRYSRSTIDRCVPRCQNERFTQHKPLHMCITWHYCIPTGLCFCNDDGSNKFGSVHRFVLLPQVPWYCNN